MTKILEWLGKTFNLKKKENCFKESYTYSLVSKWWVIEKFFENLYYGIKNIPRKTKRGLIWFKRMYNNEDWDYSGIYWMLKEKITDIEKHIREHANHTTYKRHCLIMRYALHHLEHVIDDYKCVENLFKLHHEKYGNSKIVSEPCKDKPDFSEWKGMYYAKCKTDAEQKYADKVNHRISKIWDERKAYHKRRFFYTLEKYIEYWWD